MEQRVLELLAKQDIYEVIARYTRAIDHLDEPLLRSVFHGHSTHNHFYQGPSSEPERPATEEDPGDFVRFAFQILKTYSRTHHQLGNTVVQLIDDDHANAETYFTAFHRVRPIGDPLAGPDAFETDMDFFVAGRYLDRFERIDGQWKIAHRTGMTDWIRLEAPTSRGTTGIDQTTVGRQGPDDLVYQFITV